MGAKKRKTRLNRIGQEMRREVSSKGAASRLAWMKFSHGKARILLQPFQIGKMCAPASNRVGKACKNTVEKRGKCVDKF